MRFWNMNFQMFFKVEARNISQTKKKYRMNAHWNERSPRKKNSRMGFELTKSNWTFQKTDLNAQTVSAGTTKSCNNSQVDHLPFTGNPDSRSPETVSKESERTNEQEK